jgi:hypothetical protein
MARWAASRHPAAEALAHIGERPSAGIDAQGEDPRAGSDALTGLLDYMNDEVHRHAAVARDAVSADFAARVAHARKHLSPSLLAATLAALKAQRRAALAQISRNAAAELAGRKKIAIMASRPKPDNSDRVKGGNGQPKPSPH